MYMVGVYVFNYSTKDHETLSVSTTKFLYIKKPQQAWNSEIPMKLNWSSNYCLNDRTVET